MTAENPADSVIEQATEVIARASWEVVDGPDVPWDDVDQDDRDKCRALSAEVARALHDAGMLVDPADRDERGDRLEAMVEFMADREVQALELHADEPGLRARRVCRICQVPQPCPTRQALWSERTSDYTTQLEKMRADCESFTGAANLFRGQRDHWKARAERSEAERDELEHRLACLLCELTGNRMSKTNYDVPTMVQEVEAYFERTQDSEVAELRATVQRVRQVSDSGGWNDRRDIQWRGAIKAALNGAGEQP